MRTYNILAMKVDPRFLTGEGPEVFTGNELVVKGALEADGGVHLLGGYPGSPIAGFFDAIVLIKDLLNEKGIRAVINNNEALAAAMLNGLQTLPCRGIICMKSVGVHVAADALALGNLAGAHPEGGTVVVYGDDPWSDSTQVPADSRYISKHLQIPVIEPANPQEVKDFIDRAFKLSRKAELYAGYVLTTNLADGGGTVQCKPNQYPKLNLGQKTAVETALIDVNKRVLLPPKTWWQEETLPDRFSRAIAASRELGLNRIEYAATARTPLGFVTSGMAHGYLLQALLELGLLGRFPVLKFGMSYPIDPEMVRSFAAQCERMIVIEERRGFLQEQIGEVLLRDRQGGLPAGKAELWGKEFPAKLKGIPAIRGLHPSIIISRLVPLLKLLEGSSPWMIARQQLEALNREIQTIDSTGESEIESLPPRLPTFCPGCPHRDSSSVCLQIKKRFMDEPYMRRKHACEPVDLLFHGDTGCYTMLMYPPNTPLMHDYSGMGLGGGTGAGTDPFITNKEVVFMGDSTFFHSGLIAISQAIKFGQDITFIILDNSTTAMTGHQPTPGVDYDVLGNRTAVQDIESVINGMAGSAPATVMRVDPQKRKEYAELLERTFLADGVKVIIADKECGITRMRRQRRAERQIARQRGFLPSWAHMNVNPELCTFCLSCAELTGCPGLKHTETDYGRRMDTDITWCVNDGACERIGACSAFERVTIKRKKPPRSRGPELGPDDIPEPRKRPFGEMWRCCLVGFGGMGIGLATSILVRAGHKEGYDVIFMDKKGLAIRNGGVVSQVVYNLANQRVTAVIPYGKADLLIGLDILEAARALEPKGRVRIASKDSTAAVINTDKIATIGGLMGLEDFDPQGLEKIICRHTRDEDFLARNISRICEKYLGNKLYANMMMLGFAFQKGLIPVSMHSMAWAIKDAVHTDVRKNTYAFNMGRKLVERPDLFQGPPVRANWRDLLEEKCRWTIRRFRRGQRMANQLRELTASTIEAVKALDDRLKRAIVVRTYDCMRWGGIDYARKYADGIARVFARDRADRGFAATGAVIANLAAAMLMPDLVFMAELATSPEKHARDREKYNVNPANGDRIAYKHLWHLKVKLGRWRFNLNVTPSHSLLKVLKRSRWLRKLSGWQKGKSAYLRQYQRLIAQFEESPAQQYDLMTARLSSPRCIDCMNPRCQESGCPLEGLVPQWVDLAYRGQWRRAADLLHERNNFPEFTAQICPAPCVAACKQRINQFPVQIRDIESQIMDRAFQEGWIAPQPAKVKTGKRVAIVGSGPSGLAAAQQLARAGHEVAVFEKDDSPGGLLRYGIPQFRLAKAILDRRLEQLKAEGVVFRNGVHVGVDVTGQQLRNEFDAILLAGGARRPRDLKVPGRETKGIHFALDFLRAACGGMGDGTGGGMGGGMGVPPMSGMVVPPMSPDAVKGKTVAVIGGGETGSDCVQTALLLGAKEVHQLEILPQSATSRDSGGQGLPDPIGPELAGKVRCRYGVSTRRFESNGQGLSGLRAVEVAWTHSVTGPKMREIPVSEFKINADLAVLALGFDPELDWALTEQLSLQTNAGGRVVVNGHATSTPGVFVAGDQLTGASMVAKAVATGRKAAEKIDEYLAQAQA